MPTGHGNRIVKPRSERQQEHAADYNLRPENVIALLPADAGIPRSSWWTVARSREEFDAIARRERDRMSESRFGQIKSLQIRD